MPDSTEQSPTKQQRIALTYLRISREELEAKDVNLAVAKRVRAHYVTLARDYGMTNVAIAEALGLTEGAVRLMLKGE